ncbi:MAG: M48 family metallopeptidase [Chthoniobacterales bacterium]
MDFFESQARAHRKTKWLIVYFVLAVLGIIATIHISAALAFGEPLNDWSLLGMISAGVISVVVIGAVYRISELAHGGGVVAQMLGGRLVAPHTTDLREQQLRNVVEEMALASGVPVPDVYVLDDESAINAFAAGNTPGDAVVAVTRGTLENLTRDELQGVIAHEFSHILNGDMRLNIRLIGVLHGILLLAILGQLVFRMGAWGGGSVRSSSDNKNSSAIPLFAIGAALWLIGCIGVFFAKLIKAAVSRQREFLADASAVQFTRNPDGISAALYKIGQLTSKLQSPRAEEASHLFFGNGLGESFMELFATHPPIDERIKAINPSFEPSQVRNVAAPETPAVKPSAPALAKTLLAAMPAFAIAAAHETASAVPLIYALLLSKDERTRAKQLAAITLTPQERAEVEKDIPRSAEISDAISMMDLCLPALRQLSKPQYEGFRENVLKLIACDGEVDLFEFVLHQALVRHVDHYFTKSRGPAIRYKSVVPLLPDIAIALSTIATYSGGADAAFHAGVQALMLKPDAFPMKRADATDFSAFAAALERFAEADPETRRKILNACNQAARQDGVIHPNEAALLRVISDVLGAPQLDAGNVA